MKPVPAKPQLSACPGVVIAALRGGSGKTIFSVGIIAALRSRGFSVAPFKKGPDYIDAGWLALAAGRPCYNLDTFLIDSPAILDSYALHGHQTDMAVIEGNRGLYDCIDTDGLTSTAELAKLLHLPVILVLDAAKTTRTLAAVLIGCLRFDPDVAIRGVILNQVAGARHEKIARDSITQYSAVPVLGAVPRLDDQNFPERHMGLVPTCEHEWAREAVGAIAEIAAKYLDISAIADLAGNRMPGAPAQPRLSTTGRGSTDSSTPAADHPARARKPVIGIVRDSAFQFYYPENLDALVQAGAELLVTSPLKEAEPPRVDALYLGGGFPETHAARLSENIAYRRRIKFLADAGMPIYAECGGLIYLAQELILAETVYPMAGVLPLRFGFCKRPQGHGYVVARVTRPNPFHPVGQILKGHEFHYSKLLEYPAAAAGDPENSGDTVFEMERGTGLLPGRDGYCRNSVLATYLHIHALGTPGWAPALVARAREFMERDR